MGNYANKALLFFFCSPPNASIELAANKTNSNNSLWIDSITTVGFDLASIVLWDFFPLFPVFVCVWNFARFPLNRPNSPPWDFVCSSQWWLHYWALDLFNEFIEAAKIVIFSAECFWKRHCLEICGLKIDTIHYGLKIVQLWINKKPNGFWRVVWKFMMNYY